MKILLTTLNSKYIHANLALRYLYSVAEGLSPDVELKEFTINNEPGYIYAEILRSRCDIVCFSCYIWNIRQICSLGADLKKARPQMKILLGGPEVSYDTAELMMEHPWIDYVIRGEGEMPFAQFCRAVENAENLDAADFSSVGSLSFREGETIKETEAVLPLSMEDIPFPYSRTEPAADKVVYYESSRGCPYRCSYCLSSLDKNIRALPEDRVYRELDWFLARNVKQVKFIDRTFNYDRRRAECIWRYLMDHDNGTTNFHFEICAALLDEASLNLLAGARKGLFQFEIGIQSADPKVLAASDRNDDTDFVLEQIRRLTEPAVSHIHVDLIAGLPLEDYNGFGRSFDRVYALGADNLQLGFLKLLKGTKIRSQAEAHGYVFRDDAPYEIISSRYMTADDLVRLKMVETVLELFANRGGFRRTLQYLISAAAETPFCFYEKLADFFYQNGYQHRSHKKEDLYRILSKFAAFLESESEGIAQEARRLLEADLSDTMHADAVKKFHRKGWEL